MAWLVQRHGGKNNDRWIPVYDGDDELLARDCFEQRKREMRQGSVQLYQDGRLMEEHKKPRANKMLPATRR